MRHEIVIKLHGLRSFVKSLKKYLYFDEEHQRLYCSSVEEDDKWDKREVVEHIEVVRSDSDPASNYVVCNRICQQMQIADLVIVDVSSQNANVFYEFGMAVALGKMILPICYSESFYKMVIPDKLKEKYWSLGSEDEAAHHIGLFPWRKNLFEYYGIRYKRTEGIGGDGKKGEQLMLRLKLPQNWKMIFPISSMPDSRIMKSYRTAVTETGRRRK